MEQLIRKIEHDAINKEKTNLNIKYDINSYDENDTHNNFIKLNCGATLINTPAGYIQFGIPPGSLAEVLKLGIQIPEYFIIPFVRFHKKYAINLSDFSNTVFHNFLQGKKTYFICGPLAPIHLRIIFKEIWPIWNEHTINANIDFYSSIDKNPIPNFKEEFKYLRNLFKYYNQKFSYESMIEYIVIDKKNGKLFILFFYYLFINN